MILNQFQKQVKHVKVLESLKLTQDLKRLEARKSRSGKSLLRGRSKKLEKAYCL